MLDLNDTVAGMLKMLQRLIGEDIDLAWLPGADLWPVKIDPSQIDQILANLWSTPGTPLPDVGKITIETDNVVLDEAYCAGHRGSVPGEYVLLAVSDDGCGMDQEMLDTSLRAVFHHQGDGQGHRPGAGHGLRHRQAEQRLHQRLQRAGPGHDLQDLPAPARGRDASEHRAEETAERRRAARDRAAGRGRGGDART